MARYAHIENDTITGVYDFLPNNWRNISNFRNLEEDTEFIESLGWRKIVKVEPEYDPIYYYLGNPIYTLENDVVTETIKLIEKPYSEPPPPPPPLSDEQIQINLLNQHNEAVTKLRATRDALLASSDFTQLMDVATINGEALTLAYQTYRQALRDLPTTYEQDLSFIDESTVVYPTLVLPETDPGAP